VRPCGRVLFLPALFAAAFALALTSPGACFPAPVLLPWRAVDARSFPVRNPPWWAPPRADMISHMPASLMLAVFLRPIEVSSVDCCHQVDDELALQGAGGGEDVLAPRVVVDHDVAMVCSSRARATSSSSPPSK